MALSSSQLAVLFLFTFGFLVSLAGVASPYWEYQDMQNSSGPDTKIDVGLFYACASDPASHYDECIALPWDMGGGIHSDVYFKVVRVLMVASMLFQVLGVTVSVVTCCRRHRANNVMFESVMGLLGGMAGMAGIATFSAYTNGNYNPFSGKFHLTQELQLIRGFAFYLSCSGSGFQILVALLGLCAPRRRAKYYEATTRHGRGFNNPSYTMEPALIKATY